MFYFQNSSPSEYAPDSRKKAIKIPVVPSRLVPTKDVPQPVKIGAKYREVVEAFRNLKPGYSLFFSYPTLSIKRLGLIRGRMYGALLAECMHCKTVISHGEGVYISKLGR